MIYLIGLGLSENDISLGAVDVLKKCDDIYCEFYTSNWGNLESIERIINKKIKILNREEVESDFLINESKKKDIALLTPGDPLTATTHFQLILDAKNADIECKVIHAPSIYTAVAKSGLQLYKFGRTITLTRDNVTSPYDMIRENRKSGLHTLVLLDIDMAAEEGTKLLINNNVISEDEKIVVCTNLGTTNAKIVYGEANKIKIDDVPAVIIIPGKLNFKEEEALELWK
jgi:diphthine synthase